MGNVEVKICGLTRPEQAAECVECGADAVGVVFYPRSPRNVTVRQAEEIIEAVDRRIVVVGVFVNLPVEDIVLTTIVTGLHYVQLHGSETVKSVKLLTGAGLKVIKVLKTTGDELLQQSDDYGPVSRAILVEAGKGVLPGGNRSVWNWEQANIGERNWPMVLAGGLDVENVSQAICDSGCDAVDVSSSVETTPGIKDMDKVRDFIAAVRSTNCGEKKNVFQISAISKV